MQTGNNSGFEFISSFGKLVKFLRNGAVQFILNSIRESNSIIRKRCTQNVRNWREEYFPKYCYLCFHLISPFQFPIESSFLGSKLSPTNHTYIAAHIASYPSYPHMQVSFLLSCWFHAPSLLHTSSLRINRIQIQKCILMYFMPKSMRHKKLQIQKCV